MKYMYVQETLEFTFHPICYVDDEIQKIFNEKIQIFMVNSHKALQTLTSVLAL